jgi:hypothetical protein
MLTLRATELSKPGLLGLNSAYSSFLVRLRLVVDRSTVNEVTENV